MKTALTIAGSDSSAGAGIQADLKTIAMLGGYGMSAITAVTAQNTVSITTSVALSADLVTAQIGHVDEIHWVGIRPNGVLDLISDAPTPAVLHVAGADSTHARHRHHSIPALDDGTIDAADAKLQCQR